MSEKELQAGKGSPPEEEAEAEVKYLIGGMEVSETQLWDYRVLEAEFWGAVDKYMVGQTRILYAELDKDDIKLRKMLARQAVAVTIGMDDGATFHSTKTIHNYTGGQVGIQTEHSDPHMTPVMTGSRVERVVVEPEDTEIS